MGVCLAEQGPSKLCLRFPGNLGLLVGIESGELCPGYKRRLGTHSAVGKVF